MANPVQMFRNVDVALAITDDELAALVEALDDASYDCGYLVHPVLVRLPFWAHVGHSGDQFLSALGRSVAELARKAGIGSKPP
jgi:hypothetical protein